MIFELLTVAAVLAIAGWSFECGRAQTSGPTSGPGSLPRSPGCPCGSLFSPKSEEDDDEQ